MDVDRRHRLARGWGGQASRCRRRRNAAPHAARRQRGGLRSGCPSSSLPGCGGACALTRGDWLRRRPSLTVVFPGGFAHLTRPVPRLPTCESRSWPRTPCAAVRARGRPERMPSRADDECGSVVRQAWQANRLLPSAPARPKGSRMPAWHPSHGKERGRHGRESEKPSKSTVSAADSIRGCCRWPTRGDITDT